MKKVFTLLAVAAAFTFTSCGGGAEEAHTEEAATETAAEETHAEEKSDYKVSVFYEWGWYYCALINNSNITLLCYANQNEYHKSGNPIYIIQGKIGAPDKRNTTLGDGDPTAGVVTFKALYTDPLKKDFLPYPGTIWYKNNPSGKDQLEMEAGEATLVVLIAK